MQMFEERLVSAGLALNRMSRYSLIFRCEVKLGVVTSTFGLGTILSYHYNHFSLCFYTWLFD